MALITSDGHAQDGDRGAAGAVPADTAAGKGGLREACHEWCRPLPAAAGRRAVHPAALREILALRVSSHVLSVFFEGTGKKRPSKTGRNRNGSKRLEAGLEAGPGADLCPRFVRSKLRRRFCARHGFEGI